MLWHKLWRDLWQNKGANLACITIIAIGIMAFNAFHMAVDNLDSARQAFYAASRFADVFVTVKEMPAAQLAQLEDLPGIEQVQGKLRQDVTVLMPEWGQNITLRLVGIQVEDRTGLNQVRQEEGPGITTGSNEVLLGKGFMAAHEIKAGDQFAIVVGGKKRFLTVAGSGQSPEYVYLMPDAGSWFADAATFDVAFMDAPAIADLLGKQGVINELAFRLQPGIELESLRYQIEEILEPYGLFQLVSDEDQMSNFMLTQEIQGVVMMADTLHGVFMLMAVFILYLMMRRMIEQQRSQIGTLKAFGVSNLEIITHYAAYGACLGFLGGLLGTLLGVWLSGIMTQLYGQYFQLPDLINQMNWRYSMQGFIVAVLPCVSAALLGAGSLLRLEPAQAMQPPAPGKIRKTWLERIKWLWQSFSMLWRMALRNISRNRGRSLFTATGTMLAFTILWVILSFNKLIDLMIFNQINLAQHYELKITLTEPQPAGLLVNTLESMDGVYAAEALQQAAVTLRSKEFSTDTVMTGIEQGSDMYLILDKGQQLVEVPTEGVLLSLQVAQKLHVQPGQTVYLTSDYLEEPLQVLVSGIVEQYFGMENYMSRANLDELLQTGGGVTTAIIRTTGSSAMRNALEEKLLLAPNVSSVDNKESLLKMYQTLMEPMGASIFGMVFVGVVTAFAVIYASGTVALSERQREISSSKVLGMTNREIMVTLVIENGVLSIIGIIVAIPLTKAVMLSMQQAYATELYSIPAQLDSKGFFQGLLAIGVALSLALWSMYRRVDRLDLVAVLKTRD